MSAACAGIVALAAVACGPRAPEVPLARLVAAGRSYEGRSIETEGTVCAFTDSGGTYWVLEDENANRVGLRPSREASPFVGRRVRVTGRYGVDPRAGRFIHTTRIMPDGDR